MPRCLWAIVLLMMPAVGRADLKSEVAEAIRKAVRFYHRQVSSHGGYVYRYSADLSRREGEGKAGPDTAEVQPPGTPAVGMAMVEAYEATGDAGVLVAALDAGRCLVRGQLHSGGWTHKIEFAPESRAKVAYRVEAKAGKKAWNTSSLDDDQTQSALRFLVRLDVATKQRHADVHEAARAGLDAVLANQHASGAWSQVFDGKHRQDAPAKKAAYPPQWPRKYPGGDYWWHYTFNDGAMGSVVETLLEAAELYGDAKLKAAALRGGEFILLAQMPEPQPGWAQQYNLDMQPVWARKFEPPGVSSHETVGVIRTLLSLHRATGDKRFLDPIPRAVAWLKRSRLSDGRFARFYELRTNKPLYMTRDYQFTYAPDDLPTHYGFIREDIDVAALERAYREAGSAARPTATSKSPSEKLVRQIIAGLDKRGAWVEQGVLKYHGKRTEPIIDSATLARNLSLLSAYLAAAK